MMAHVMQRRSLNYTSHKYASVRLGQLCRLAEQHNVPARETAEGVESDQDGYDSPSEIGENKRSENQDPADDSAGTGFSLEKSSTHGAVLNHWLMDYVARPIALTHVGLYLFAARLVKVPKRKAKAV